MAPVGLLSDYLRAAFSLLCDQSCPWTTSSDFLVRGQSSCVTWSGCQYRTLYAAHVLTHSHPCPMHKHTYLPHSYRHVCSFRHTDRPIENTHIHAYVCTPARSDISFCARAHPHTSTLNAFTRTLISTVAYTQSQMQVHGHHFHTQSHTHSCSNNHSTYINSCQQSHITHAHSTFTHTHISTHTLVHMYAFPFLHSS